MNTYTVTDNSATLPPKNGKVGALSSLRTGELAPSGSRALRLYIWDDDFPDHALRLRVMSYPHNVALALKRASLLTLTEASRRTN